MYSSNAGVCPGSTQPCGLRMCATLTSVVFEYDTVDVWFGYGWGIDNVKVLSLSSGLPSVDSDGDLIPNECDDCPFDSSDDYDGDFRCADVDNCSVQPNPDQADHDGDGRGDVCDPDDDEGPAILQLVGRFANSVSEVAGECDVGGFVRRHQARLNPEPSCTEKISFVTRRQPHLRANGDASGRKLKFLRRIPMDPMTRSQEWGMRSYQDDADSTSWGGQNVYDVFTRSDGVALDGTKYADW